MESNITVVGAGYVGLSMALLLAAHNKVTVVDIDASKIEMLKHGKSPITDAEIEEALPRLAHNLEFVVADDDTYKNAGFVIVSTPTDFNDATGYFDTKHVTSVLRQVKTANESAYCIVKSTVPVGYIESIREELDWDRVTFSPEFLREGKALYDNLHPSRIIVGEGERAEEFAKLLQQASADDVEVIITSNTNAEAIKLFSNTYLAMRVSFFNELDTFAEENKLDAGTIIAGVSLDPRIGGNYNNPSFGYGGYCLPKDTKQLLANYRNTPQALITGIVNSNVLRKDFVAEQIRNRGGDTVGVYRLVMKHDSDNFRNSSVVGIINRLKKSGMNVVIYEPLIDADTYEGCPVVNDFDDFAGQVTTIVANRMHEQLDPVMDKVYTRDQYTRD